MARSKAPPRYIKFPASLFGLLRTPAQYVILLRVMSRCNYDGTGECNESQQNMADACSVTPDTVAKTLRQLEQAGYINIVRHHRKPNSVTLTIKMQNYMVKPLDPKLSGPPYIYNNGGT